MRLTTDSSKYHSEIKKLLTSNYDDEWTPLWSYCEMTSMLIEGYSFTFLAKDGLRKRKFLYRRWSYAEQDEKNDLGIFNLEGVKISEEEDYFSLHEVYEIQNILEAGLKITKTDKIVLDGIDFEMTDFRTNQTYTWKLEEETGVGGKRIVEIMRGKK